MPRYLSPLLVSLYLFPFSARAAAPHETFPAPIAAQERGRIFCADGAGASPEMTNTFRQAVAEAGLPLSVERVEWSHGRYRVLADEIAYRYLRAQGHALAQTVTAYRCSCPNAEVYLVGQSAGTGVVLAALEELPPGTVERAFLLAPSVSAGYDLRPALSATRRGIEVYYSRRDRFVLGLATTVVGTTDRRHTAPAGRVGFRPIIACDEDQVLYSRLSQHAWSREVVWTGNRGGHFGSYKIGFLRAYIVPLLAGG
jgi:hypothetical protein